MTSPSVNLSFNGSSDESKQSWMQKDDETIRAKVQELTDGYFDSRIVEALTGLNPDRRVSVVLKSCDPERYKGDLFEQLLRNTLPEDLLQSQFDR